MKMLLQERVLNGIDTEKLQEVAGHIKANPADARSKWSVTSTWRGGTRSDHLVEKCELGSKTIQRTFNILVDEPLELLGGNKFANPQEYLLAATNACMMVGFAATAAMMGIKLSKLEIELSGEIDLRGFLEIDSTVPIGYKSLQSTVHIAGDGTKEQFEKIHEHVKRTSPNYYNMTQPIEIKSKLIVE